MPIKAFTAKTSSKLCTARTTAPSADNSIKNDSAMYGNISDEISFFPAINPFVFWSKRRAVLISLRARKDSSDGRFCNFLI